MVALKSIQRNIAYNEHFRHFRCNFSPVRAWASLLSHRNRSASVCLYQESPRSAPNEYHLDDTDNFDDQDKDWDDVNQDEGYREVLNSMTRPRARLWRRTTAAFELAVRAIVSICTWRQFLFNECRWGRWRIMWFYLEESLMPKVIWWRLLMMINLYPESQSPASLRGGTHPQASLQAECLVVGDPGDAREGMSSITWCSHCCPNLGTQRLLAGWGCLPDPHLLSEGSSLGRWRRLRDPLGPQWIQWPHSARSWWSVLWWAGCWGKIWTCWFVAPQAPRPV